MGRTMGAVTVTFTVLVTDSRPSMEAVTVTVALPAFSPVMVRVPSASSAVMSPWASAVTLHPWGVAETVRAWLLSSSTDTEAAERVSSMGSSLAVAVTLALPSA